MVRTAVRLVCLLGLFAPLALPAIELDELVARHVEARGGRERIAGVDSVRATGKVLGPDGVEAPFAWEWMRPNRVRLELTVGDETAIHAFDGTWAWIHAPFAGKAQPELLPEEQGQGMTQEADFDGFLVDWEEKGHTLTLVGSERVADTDAYRIDITLATGGQRVKYLDASTYLDLRDEGTVQQGAATIHTVTTYGDYREVDGLLLPFRLEVGLKDMPPQVFVTEEIVLDAQIDPARFAFPGELPEEAVSATEGEATTGDEATAEEESVDEETGEAGATDEATPTDDPAADVETVAPGAGGEG